MDSDKHRCAQAAMSTVPEDYRTVTADVVVAVHNGHSFHRGMHIAWAWSPDECDGVFLDFLSDHRHPGVAANRFFPDGRSERLPTPPSTRRVSDDPQEDAEIQKRFSERNQVAYGWLTTRGLLLRNGFHTAAHEVGEVLRAPGG